MSNLFMGVSPKTFNHISGLMASKKPIKIFLDLYTPRELINFCRTTFTWIDQTAPTPINAKRLYKELEEKFTIDDYPELWI